MATAYVVAMDSPALLDSTRRRRLIERIAATEARSALEDDLGRVGSLLVERLGLTAEVVEGDAFVWRSAPAGWRMMSYDGDRTEVAIWGTGFAMARGHLLASPTWRTTFVDLVWERGDWRLVGFRSEPGPEPPAHGDATSGRVVARAIQRFEPFTFQPQAENGR